MDDIRHCRQQDRWCTNHKPFCMDTVSASAADQLSQGDHKKESTYSHSLSEFGKFDHACSNTN